MKQVEMLTRQHRHLENLFYEITLAEDDRTRAAILEDLARALSSP